MKKIIYISIVCLFLFSWIPENKSVTISTTNELVYVSLAFPGALGHGKNTTGGKGGSVIFVTNLNNSGSGSFREAVTTSGARTVIFRVGGTINLTSDITITNGNLTIAGESAPGDGIAIHGKSVIISNCDNIIMRHIRIRGGDTATDDTVRLIQTSGTEMNGFIFDHCSFSWAADENVGTGGGRGNAGIRNVTFQNCINSESFNGYGVLMYHETHNFSFIRNLFAHNPDRNPATSTETSSYEFINNVVYHFQYGTQTVVQNTHDIINNVYLDGIGTALEVVKLVACNNCTPSIDSGAGTDYYIDGNTYNGGPIPALNSRYTQGTSHSSAVNSSGYTPLPTSQVADTILSNVGARRGISGLDVLDTKIINSVKNNTGGYVTTESQAGGLPVLSNGTPYTDSDSDGMDDAWETTNFGDLTKGNNGFDLSVDYTNLQMFLSYLAGDEGTPAPTCSDGIQNGDETGIDCGGSCSPCSIPETSTGAGARAFMNYLLTN